MASLMRCSMPSFLAQIQAVFDAYMNKQAIWASMIPCVMPKWMASFEPSSMLPIMRSMMPSSHPSSMPSSMPNLMLLAAIILAKLYAIFDAKHGAKLDAIISA
eukprot:7969476-Ditylum_brightwellii.AAC.1